ncbi:MAG: zinc ribbon domain-containing protein [Solirubrobacteraceae bacterium]
MNRLRRRSSEPALEPTPGTSATPEQPTTVQPAVDPATEGLPAGQALSDGEPSFRHRGRARRRLRYLRRIRELGFRDLGGLVFDQHRFDRRNDDLVRAKVEALRAVDRELRALEHVLGDERPITELREPGVSVCPRCGALPGSDARFCPSCGTPQQGARTIAGVGPGEASPQALAPTAQPAPDEGLPPPVPAEEPAEAATAQHEAARPAP